MAGDGRSAFDIAEQAARAAGASIMQRLPEMTGPSSKRRVKISSKAAWNDLVTEVDHAAEKAALAIIGALFPDDSVLAEESDSKHGTSEYTWLIDPLDGTRNFASGIPHFAVNLALSREGDTMLGMTYDPVRDELFSAMKGAGAHLNGEPIVVSEETRLEQCVLEFDLGIVAEKGHLMLDMIGQLWPGMQSARMMGSAALGLAYTASGRLDLYANHHAQPWDLAPGLLMMREAGGIATDIAGANATPESGCVVAASPAIHRAFTAATDGMPWRRSQV